LLVVVATAFAEGGFTVLRCDLPYRQKRRHGPPFRGEDRLDREGLRNAIAVLNELDSKPRRVLLGGHSYCGRQATSLVSFERARHNLLAAKSRERERRTAAEAIFFRVGCQLFG
jgi:uncharacterized protein